MLILKMPFASLYFVDLTDDGYLAWSHDKQAAMVFASREAAVEYLPAEVPIDTLVCVPVEG